jgi:probable rRNA maturation factor
MENFEISTTLKKNPKFKKKFWEEAKNEILGKNYELSLVFIGDKKSKSLNINFRKKDYSANVLSFSIDKDFGEIFINFPNAKKECIKFERKTENFIDFLFIHGLSHLKGYDHLNEKDSEEMEGFEKKIRKKLGV